MDALLYAIGLIVAFFLGAAWREMYPRQPYFDDSKKYDYDPKPAFNDQQALEELQEALEAEQRLKSKKLQEAAEAEANYIRSLKNKQGW